MIRWAAAALGSAAVVALGVPATALEAQDDVPDSLAVVEGDPQAPVTVTEFLDFGCSACALFATSTLPVIRRDYIEPGRVRWRMVPFVMGSFRRSAEAARAAWCAHRQGRFQAMHDALFATRERWMSGGDAEEALVALAASLDLNRPAFVACYRSDAAEDRVDRQTRAARRARVRATPTFLLGDRTVLGALTAPAFASLLDTFLAGTTSSEGPGSGGDGVGRR